MNDAEHARAHDELSRRVLDDTAPVPVAAAARRAWPTLLGTALLLPMAGGMLYVLLGNPNALDANAAAPVQTASAAAGPGDIGRMVSSLVAKLASHPDDPAGWAMLGRSYAVLGRYREAAAAYERIGPELNRHADWLAQDADALSMVANGNPAGAPERLARQALAIDPNNLLALMLAGYATEARGDYAAALPMLQRAQARVAPGSDDAAFLQNLIAKCSDRSGSPSGAASTPHALDIAVSIAPDLRLQARGRVFFLIARAPGSRMPVAVVKRQADELPARVALADSDSLDPSHPLSSLRRVDIEARVSASGDATASPGDLYGSTVIDAARVDGGSVTIDAVRGSAK